jgi:hypothetical protein
MHTAAEQARRTRAAVGPEEGMLPVTAAASSGGITTLPLSFLKAICGGTEQSATLLRSWRAASVQLCCHTPQVVNRDVECDRC